jgi:hypothetical protein
MKMMMKTRIESTTIKGWDKDSYPTPMKEAPMAGTGKTMRGTIHPPPTTTAPPTTTISNCLWGGNGEQWGGRGDSYHDYTIYNPPPPPPLQAPAHKVGCELYGELTMRMMGTKTMASRTRTGTSQQQHEEQG